MTDDNVDELNDETFGDLTDSVSELPSFFQMRGTTVLEALDDLSLNVGGDDDKEEADNYNFEDRYGSEKSDPSNLNLPSFFNAEIKFECNKVNSGLSDITVGKGVASETREENISSLISNSKSIVNQSNNYQQFSGISEIATQKVHTTDISHSVENTTKPLVSLPIMPKILPPHPGTIPLPPNFSPVIAPAMNIGVNAAPLQIAPSLHFSTQPFSPFPFPGPVPHYPIPLPFPGAPQQLPNQGLPQGFPGAPPHLRFPRPPFPLNPPHLQGPPPPSPVNINQMRPPSLPLSGIASPPPAQPYGTTSSPSSFKGHGQGHGGRFGGGGRFQYQQSQTRQRELPSGQMMGPSDVRFVVGRVLLPTRTEDPYHDCYYQVQLSLKKYAETKAAALASNSPPPLVPPVPIPSWRKIRENSQQQLEYSRQIHRERTKHWEESEHVLGHNSKSEVSRPRQLLSFNTSQNNEEEEEDEYGLDEGGIIGIGGLRLPFSGRLWSLRAALQRGYEALYTVQELQILLGVPQITGNHQTKLELEQEYREATNVLAVAMGLRSKTTSTTSDSEDPQEQEQKEQAAVVSWEVEGALLSAILQVNKGKLLVSRCTRLLSPEQRWVLLPALISRIIQIDAAHATSEDMASEGRLLNTISLFLHSELEKHQQLKSIQSQQLLPFSNDLSYNLRQCIKNVVIAQIEKNQLRKSLLSFRLRAEVLHSVVKIGDVVTAEAGDEYKQNWTQMRETFMALVDA